MQKIQNTNNKFELVFWELRASIGILFVTAGINKFNESFAKYLSDVGLPLELQISIALAELLGGVFLIVGFLTRISAGVLASIMVGAIVIKQISMPFEIVSVETDLIFLSVCILILVVGSEKYPWYEKSKNPANSKLISREKIM